MHVKEPHHVRPHVLYHLKFLRQEVPPRLFGFFVRGHGDGNVGRLKRHPRARPLEKSRKPPRAIAPPQSVHHATVRRCSSGERWPCRISGSSSPPPLHLIKSFEQHARGWLVCLASFGAMSLRTFCPVTQRQHRSVALQQAGVIRHTYFASLATKNKHTARKTL